MSSNGARGRTSRPSAIARIRSASAAISYRDRNLVERLFNKIKQCRRVATRYDRLAANYLAFVKLACIRLWLRVYSAPLLTSSDRRAQIFGILISVVATVTYLFFQFAYISVFCFGGALMSLYIVYMIFRETAPEQEKFILQ